MGDAFEKYAAEEALVIGMYRKAAGPVHSRTRQTFFAHLNEGFDRWGKHVLLSLVGGTMNADELKSIMCGASRWGALRGGEAEYETNQGFAPPKLKRKMLGC